jgi:hypothetical protein
MSVAVLGTNVGQSRSITKKNVMAGLCRGHPRLDFKIGRKESLDAPHKAGHDEQELS